MPSAAQIEWPQGNPLFEVQWRAVAESLAGNGIRASTDLVVSATANALEIEVASGTAYYIGSEYTLGTASTFTLTSGGTSDRWDTVYFDTATSSAGVREGTAGSSPEPPDVQGDELLLAVVYVPANATDVPDSDVLNWRAQFSNEAEEIHYDDSTGTYAINNVDSALDELQEAAQILAYPLAIGDLNAPYAPTNIASVNGYPFLNSDLSNSTITVNAGTSLTTTNASIGLGGSATIDVGSGAITLTELNSPFALPSISDMDTGGNDLTDSTTTIWDTSLSHVPRPQIDDEKVTTGPHTANITTSGEEVLYVDTSGGIVTVTLASSDVSNGNFVTIIDVGGASDDNPITIDTESTETIDGSSTSTIDTNYGAKVVSSDGTNWYSAGGGGGGGGYVYSADFDHSGSINNLAGGDQALLGTCDLASTETLEIYKAQLHEPDASATMTGVDLIIATLPGDGTYTVQTTIISSDGTTIFDDQTGDPLASYSPTANETVAVLIDNTTTSAYSVYGEAKGTVK